MSVRVPGGGVTKNPFGPNWVGGKEGAQSVGDQIQNSLFGRKKPNVIDSDDALTARLLAEMHTYRRRLARLAGDQPDDYDLLLADSTIAMIDSEGIVYIGEQFLLEYAGDKDVRVGVLAHEIGHRPKRWNEYKSQPPTNRAEAEDLCRLEETRADFFAGYALAQFDMDCDPLCEFLDAITTQPHPEYFPPSLRAVTIREGHETGHRKASNLQKFFPELARMTSAKGDLGTG